MIRVSHVTTGLQRWAAGGSYVAFENLLETATMSASSESGEFTADLAANWFAGDQKWKAASAVSPQWLQADFGSTKSVDALALYGHNLGTAGASVKLQWADIAAGPWTDFIGPLIPADDNSIMGRAGAPVLKQHWRILIENPTTAPVIAVAFVGLALRVFTGPEEGFQPPNLNREDEILNSRSDGGEFLGRSLIRTGGRGTLTVRHAPPSWIRSEWEPFRLAARAHPFFWAWNLDSYPGETVLAYSDKTDEGPSHEAGGFFMTHSMELIAL